MSCSIRPDKQVRVSVQSCFLKKAPRPFELHLITEHAGTRFQ